MRDEARTAEGPMPDRLLGGRLLLHQPAAGHRAGTDAVLLAAAAPTLNDGVFVDVGAGVGTAGLALALRSPDAEGVLLESEPAAADLARANAALNGLAGRVSVVEADLFARGAARQAAGRAEAAALVITNPPFYAAGTVRPSADPYRVAAHVGTRRHGDWLVACAALLAPRGRLVLIHRPDALPALLAACEGRLGGVAVRPVMPRAGVDAHRILLTGVKGSRAPLRLAPPLVLHGLDGGFTAEAEAIHRGEAMAAP